MSIVADYENRSGGILVKRLILTQNHIVQQRINQIATFRKIECFLILILLFLTQKNCNTKTQLGLYNHVVRNYHSYQKVFNI